MSGTPDHHHLFKQKNGVQRGPSSYHMQNPEIVFQALNLNEGDVVLDIGCGQGDYSLAAAKIVGETGVVYAIDRWPKLAEGLQEDAEKQKLKNLKAITAEIKDGLPISDNLVDLCMLGTILHGTTLEILQQGLASEISRVLRSNGRVAVLECKKEEQSFGPSYARRLSPTQVKDAFEAHGFDPVGYVDLGYNYLLLFECRAG